MSKKKNIYIYIAVVILLTMIGVYSVGAAGDVTIHEWNPTDIQIAITCTDESSWDFGETTSALFFLTANGKEAYCLNPNILVRPEISRIAINGTDVTSQRNINWLAAAYDYIDTKTSYSVNTKRALKQAFLWKHNETLKINNNKYSISDIDMWGSISTSTMNSVLRNAESYANSNYGSYSATMIIHAVSPNAGSITSSGRGAQDTMEITWSNKGKLKIIKQPSN